MEKPYTINRKRPGADCGFSHELLLPFRNALNQSPYVYTLEVMNKFKGLHLVDRVPEELKTEIGNTTQEAVTKTIPKKQKCKKAKWLSKEALQIAEEKEK